MAVIDAENERGAVPEAANNQPAWASFVQLLDGRLVALSAIWLVVSFVLRPALIGAHIGEGGMLSDMLRARMDVFSLARALGVCEWLAFALSAAILVVLHARAVAAGMCESARGRFGWTAAYAIALPAAFAAFLWNQSSVITLMAHDTFIFVDAVYRIQSGQVPSVDFETPIGAAALYGPTIGAWISGGYAGSVEIASALLAAALGLACGWACAARVGAWVGALMVALVFLIVTPMGLLAVWPGQSVTLVGDAPFLLTDQLTHAMFYNRWGWGALLVCLLFLTPRRDGRTPLGEIVLFAGLLTLLFYLKLTYFVVAGGAAFVTALLGPRFRYAAGLGAGLVALFILVIGLPSGLLGGYLSEIARASAISGNQLDLLAPVIRGGLTPLLIATGPLVLIAMYDRLTWRDGLVALVILGGSLLIISQNAQKGTICSLAAMGVYGQARLSGAGVGMRRAAMAVLILLSAPIIVERSMTLMDRSTAIRREEARPPAVWADLGAIAGLHIAERESALELLASVETQDERTEALGAVGTMGRRQELRQGEFISLVLDGLTDLREVVVPGESVVTIDMSNPFSSLLGSRPAQGDWLSLHHERTFGETDYPPPEAIFADADHVMIARLSMLQTTADIAREVYGPWLAENYPHQRIGRYWIRYSRHNARSTQAPQLRGLSREPLN